MLTLAAGVWFAWLTFPIGGQAPDGARPSWFPLIFVAFLVYRGLSEALGWWFRTYDVQDDRLVIEEGIFTRKLKVVPYARLQQADTYQGLISQMANLAQLRCATAGEAGSTTVTLRLLDRPGAEHLRAWMLQRRNELTAPAAPPAHRTGDDDHDAPGPTPPPPERPLVSLDTGQLLLGAVTGTPVAVLLWGLVVLGLPALLGAVFGDASLITRVFAATGIGGTFLLVVVALMTVTWVVGFSRYQLSLVGDDIQVRYGLFQVQHITLPRRRVQRVVVDDNPLRRAFGLVSVTAYSAATASGEGATHINVPVLPRGDVGPFIVEMMGSPAWAIPPIHPRPGSAKRRGIIRRCGFLALLGLAVAPASWPALVVPAVAVASLGLPWGLVAHRRAGWCVSESMVALAAGVLHHRTSIVPIARIQSARTSVSPLQRLAGLATFELDVAGSPSGARLYDMDRTVARELRTTLPRRSLGSPNPA